MTQDRFSVLAASLLAESRAGAADFEKTIVIAMRCGLDSDCNP